MSVLWFQLVPVGASSTDSADRHSSDVLARGVASVLRFEPRRLNRNSDRRARTIPTGCSA